MAKISDRQRARLLKLLKQAEADGTSAGDIIRTLAPLYGRRQVQRFLRESRDES